MSAIENSKLAIIGAGAVGTSLAYAALIRQSAREVVLYDINKPKVEAEVLDLAHGTQFTGASCVSGGADLDAIAGSNMVVITAGARQHPGQSRLDMSAVNVGILRELMPKLVERAPDAVFMIVTNPCDIVTYAALHFSGLPSARVFGSGTVLDSSRLRWLLAHRVGVAIANVHADIIGEHGDSEFPLWSQARVGPISLSEWVKDDISPASDDRAKFSEAEFAAITKDVKTAAYRVIAGKGATNYAIGLSGARIVEAVLRDEGAILPISSLLTDYRGISRVALSVPAVVNADGVSRVIEVPFSDAEQELFQHSADTLRATLDTLSLP
ncbi:MULTISPECIES: L-lactate dehydrogenase [unclassified Cryobacterium]|uniref:L-lactate dehydrogenase n=1 Tax=unclassified Cryobacterium TaxID=2649013 RepID=UPI002AB346AA|nr:MULTISPECIES: L-lactate dehydrogenase [unclassified Cryobacterium]MDY7543042.1 L-lactate dehydrogenase [Cryobacterium sp. 5B3]MDY7544395.1 L-lactate dehydrogenase [Cryobacterium sp. 5B3]MEB0000961.1 L-lactate dehydrogenase [Cryobacterium sp. RTS3]MEB0267840.1 L-lactate dehydrogenase [Cryobacterium sp. 10I5]MEB0276736.1 L-lactate dehydrogenase [Cryobacterium sp. 5B3]